MNPLHDTLVDTLSTRHRDMRRLRVINASPSQDPYDYVVRKELDDSFEELKALIPTTVAPTPTPVIANNILTQDVLLTTNITINPPTTSGITLWIVKVRQNATGSWTSSWGVDVVGGPLINPTFNGEPNTMSIITFALFGAKWYNTSAVLGIATI